MGPYEHAGVALQERDFEILVGLFECRVMTLSHISDLYFDGKSETAKKRVQKLKAAGLLRERPRRIGDPSVLYIGKKAYLALRESGKLEGFPPMNIGAFEKRANVSSLTLRHELEVMDVRAAFFRAIKEHPHLSILEFSTWPELNKFTTQHVSSKHGRQEVLVKPDGFIRIQEETTEGISNLLFFLEVDRSTESQEILAQKSACYLSYYQSGGFALRMGARREEFKAYPFRVLMVLKTEKRRNNTADRLLRNDPPILTQIWLSTFVKVIKKPLGSAWARPKDFTQLQLSFKSLIEAPSKF